MKLQSVTKPFSMYFASCPILELALPISGLIKQNNFSLSLKYCRNYEDSLSLELIFAYKIHKLLKTGRQIGVAAVYLTDFVKPTKTDCVGEILCS